MSDTAKGEAPSGDRPCPSCGTDNAAEREICRTCGADLDTGDGLPWPQQDPLTAVSVEPVVDAPHPRRWWVAAGAVLAATATVLLGLVIAGVGPFAEQTPLPEVNFRAQVYAEEPGALTLSDVATISTQAPTDDRAFEADRIGDDDPATAWRSEDLPSEAPLEIIDLHLEQPAWISAIVVRNGDQLDDDTYGRWGRLARVRAMVDGDHAYVLNLLDDGRGRQLVEFPEPVLSTTLRLEVLDVYPGSGDGGVAVSGIELHGWQAEDGDVGTAVERADLSPAAG